MHLPSLLYTMYKKSKNYYSLDYKMTLVIKSKYYEDIKKAVDFFDENYSTQLKLEEIAAYIGISKHYLSKVFKEYAGLTPMQFLQATTLSHLKEKLKTSKSILDTSSDFGLSSSNRFREPFVNFVGITPDEYKKMGQNLNITYGFGLSPFGKTMIAMTSKGICSLEFYEKLEKEILCRLKVTWKHAQFIQDDTKAQELLNRIFINKEKMNLFVKGTNFQINVWKALLHIEKGEVSSYSDVAFLLKKPKAIRAVATAIGSNHVGFLIPCHRVISKTAAMSGYRWGIGRKRMILAYEEND